MVTVLKSTDSKTRTHKVQKTSLSAQAGAISLVTIFAIAFVGLAMLCAVKIAPIYIDHWSVKEALQAVIEESAHEGVKSKKAIQKKLDSRLMVNRLEFLTPDDLELSGTKTELTGILNYERRVPLMLNLDVVVKFQGAEVSANRAASSGR